MVTGIEVSTTLAPTMEVILAHPELQGFRRWVLATKDAHELYRKFGFHELKLPERWMERHDPNTEERPDYWNPAGDGGAQTGHASC